MTANSVVRPFLLACAVGLLFAFAALHAPPADAAGSGRADKSERKVIRLINRIRARHDLPRLRRSRALMRSSDYHSWDMLRANFFAHTSANGQSMGDRIRSFKPAARIGENLAWVPSGKGSRRSARTVVRMWMDSPGHRAVILSTEFSRIGIGRRAGVLGSTRAIVYTADFSSRR